MLAHLPDPVHQLLVIGGLVREPLCPLMHHHQPLVHSPHLLVQGFLLPGRSDNDSVNDDNDDNDDNCNIDNNDLTGETVSHTFPLNQIKTK